MAQSQTHYDVLGVGSGATYEELRSAYVRLARRYHPDFHHDAAPDERRRTTMAMVLLNDAWATLSDPDLRHQYDQQLFSNAVRHQRVRAAGTAAGTWTPYDDSDDDVDLEEDDADVAGRHRVPSWLAVSPAVIAVVAAGSFVAAGVGVPGFLQVAVVCVALAALSMVALVFWSLLSSRRAETE